MTHPTRARLKIPERYVSVMKGCKLVNGNDIYCPKNDTFFGEPYDTLVEEPPPEPATWMGDTPVVQAGDFTAVFDDDGKIVKESRAAPLCDRRAAIKHTKEKNHE